MTYLIVDELLDETPIQQVFTCNEFTAIERVRPHLAFINIDNSSNPGSLTVRIRQSDETLIQEKTLTFAQIIAADTADRDVLGDALASTNAEWHGFISFIFDNVVNLHRGEYIMEVEADYNYTYDAYWCGWVMEHDDPPYAETDGYIFPDDINQDQVPHTFEIFAWQVQRDFGI